MVLAWARRLHRPAVVLSHGLGYVEEDIPNPGDVALVVWNSEWVRERSTWPGRSIVVYPLVDPDQYRTKRGNLVVQVNLSADKGGHLFWELARRLPDRRFLGVMGGWGRQVIPSDPPPNVELMEYTHDPREIYARARVILMPSKDLGEPGTRPAWTESFGRVAIEAAASGIPTIAHPTPGLVEALGEAGIFANRHDVGAWVDALTRLDDRRTYNRYARAARKRSRDLDARGQLDVLERALESITQENATVMALHPEGKKIDALATQMAHADHLVPVWNALPPEWRGTFWVLSAINDHVWSKGVEAEPYGSRAPEVHHVLRKRGSEFVMVAGTGDLKRASDADRKVILLSHGSGGVYHADDPDRVYPSYLRGRGCERVILFLSPGPELASHQRRVWPDIPVEVVGMPKLDTWHVRPRKPRSRPPVVAVSFHYDGVKKYGHCPELGTAWPYYKDGLHLILGERWKVIGNAHPLMIDEVAPVYESLGIEVVRDFEEVMERADVYCVDASSTLWEFASTDRPVVLLNAPWFPARTENESLRFWRCADVGVNCDRPEDLPGAIDRALRDPRMFKDARRRVAAQIYGVTDGSASRKAADAIILAVMEAQGVDLAPADGSRPGWVVMTAKAPIQGTKRTVGVGERFWARERMARILSRKGVADRV